MSCVHRLHRCTCRSCGPLSSPGVLIREEHESCSPQPLSSSPKVTLSISLLFSRRSEGSCAWSGGWGGVDRTKLGFPCRFKPLSELCYPPPCLEGAVHLRGSEELSAEGWGRTAVSLSEAPRPPVCRPTSSPLSGAVVPVYSQSGEKCTYKPGLDWKWERKSQCTGEGGVLDTEDTGR